MAKVSNGAVAQFPNNSVAGQGVTVPTSDLTPGQEPYVPDDRRTAAKNLRDARSKDLGAKIAFDLSQVLADAHATQTEVANALGYGRGWLNKVLHNRNEISLVDYLFIVDMVKEFIPDHPAVALLRLMRSHRRGRLRVVKD